MCHNALINATFYKFLEQIDEDEAARTRAAGCPVCGCRLDSARYPRKPRGGPREFDEQSHYRFSFCGAICRSRTTPVSVRFLGRRVYWAAVVILATALRSGLSDRRAQQLSRLIGVPKRTLKRWRTWWLKDFVDSPFWKNARAQFMPPVETSGLPASLLERFSGSDLAQQLVAALRFLAPLSKGRCSAQEHPQKM
ncbi:MAG: hypothetical protein J2P51_06835 [Hyphomicrobiaceae bacterium]|nr:hypothetical protein [Hyphomicrobiaceae bacterium]